MSLEKHHRCDDTLPIVESCTTRMMINSEPFVIVHPSSRSLSPSGLAKQTIVLRALHLPWLSFRSLSFNMRLLVDLP